MDIISSYTRKEAIEDGVLIDISKQAYGLFKCSVAITDTAFKTAMKKLSEDNDNNVKNIQRLILSHLFSVVRFSKSSQVFFDVDSVKFKSMPHGGDLGELCLTIMLPNED